MIFTICEIYLFLGMVRKCECHFGLVSFVCLELSKEKVK